jgi:hypothetical protein
MIVRAFIFSLFVALSCAADEAISERKSAYWDVFSPPQAPNAMVEFKIDQQNLAMTSAGDARIVLEHCLLLGCEVSKINGITFYMPSSLQIDAPLKVPTSSMIEVTGAKDMGPHISQNKGKVCFIWAGKHAEFEDVLAIAAFLTKQKVPFYFGVKDELVNKIRLSFL